MLLLLKDLVLLKDEFLEEELMPLTAVDGESTRHTAMTVCESDSQLQQLLTTLQQVVMPEADKELSQGIV